MSNSTSVASLFQPPPDQWGLRGDPYLWDELTQYLIDTPLPGTRKDLVALVEAAFERLTGHSIATPDDFHMERHSHGGMSSGLISMEFWRGAAIPLLKSRLTVAAPSTRD